MPEPLGGALHQQAEIIALIAFAIADMSMIKRIEL